MRALSDGAPFIQNDYEIRKHDRGRALGHYEGRRRGGKLSNCGAEFCIRRKVQSGCTVVKNQNSSAVNKGARNGQPLFLPEKLLPPRKTGSSMPFGFVRTISAA